MKRKKNVEFFICTQKSSSPTTSSLSSLLLAEKWLCEKLKEKKNNETKTKQRTLFFTRSSTASKAQ